VTVQAPQRMKTLYTDGERINLHVANQQVFSVEIDDKSQNLKGQCSVGQMEDIKHLYPGNTINCHLQFNGQRVEMNPTEIFTSTPGFDVDSGRYTCSLMRQKLSESQIKHLSMGDVSVTVTASVQGNHRYKEHIGAQVPIYPGFYIDLKEIVLTNHYTSSDLKIYGAPDMLNNLDVKTGLPVITVYLKERSHGTPSFVTYEVGVTDVSVLSQGSLSTTLTVSCRLSDQTITVPVQLISVKGPAKGFSTDSPGLFQHFIESYQMMFFTLFALLAGAAILIIVCSPREKSYQPAVYLNPSPHSANHSFPAVSPAHYSAQTSPNRRNQSGSRILWSPNYATN
ncbi:hypothetical protein GDO86_019818, partial [Hymenochirus boettgeri]